MDSGLALRAPRNDDGWIVFVVENPGSLTASSVPE